jgi:hypothetical protein
LEIHRFPVDFMAETGPKTEPDLPGVLY